MYTEREIEAADEILDQIVSKKQELEAFLNPIYGEPQDEAKEMRLSMEEIFDEAYHDKWVKNVEISGDIGWPTFIPPLGALSFRTPVQKAHDAYNARNATGTL